MKGYSYDDLKDIIRGSHFYASGGGGAYINGELLLKDTKRVMDEKGLMALPYLDVDDPEVGRAGFYAPFVGAVGSPQKYCDDGFIHSPQWAFDLHQQVMQHVLQLRSTTFDCVQVSPALEFQSVIAIETGTLTYGMAMLLAAQKNIPIMNMDGCGRAVPVLPMVGPAQNVPGAPRLSPVALVSETTIADGGAQLVINTDDLGNLNDMMHGIISDDQGFDQRSAMSCFAISGQAIQASQQGYYVSGSLERARLLGAAIRLAGKESLAKQIEAVSGGIKVTTATVVHAKNYTEQGFDLIEVIMHEDGGRGRIYRAIAENETLLLETKESGCDYQPAVMGPDSICYVTTDGQTLSNTEIKEGMHVHVFAVQAAQGMNTPALQKLFINEINTVRKQLGIKPAITTYVSPFVDHCQNGGQ